MNQSQPHGSNLNQLQSQPRELNLNQLRELNQSQLHELNLNQQVPPYPCGVVQEVDRDSHKVPHYLPGTNPYTTEYAIRQSLPVEATRGGAETMYPDFAKKMKTLTPSRKPAPPPAPPAAPPARRRN